MTKKLLHKKYRFCQNLACKNQFYQVKFLENWLKVVKTEEKFGFAYFLLIKILLHSSNWHNNEYFTF